MRHLACNSVAVISMASLLLSHAAAARECRSSGAGHPSETFCATFLGPPTQKPASDSGKSQDGDTPGYDAACLKQAIANVKRRVEAQAKKFNDENHEAARREYNAAREKWDEERKRRNSTRHDDDRGRENNGVSNRDDNFSDRSAGAKSPPAPKMPAYQKWSDLMKSEVAAERKADPNSGARGGKPLIPADDPLAGKELNDLVKKFRDTISDARLMSMIDDVHDEYLKLAQARTQESPARP